jgi:GT2 family glycosyltransferase
MGLKQSRGKLVVILDPATEFTGDLLGAIETGMTDPSVSVLGPWGLRSKDLQHFHEEVIGIQDADAMQVYCFAFRRHLLREVGLMRECFQFYRNLDLDFSFQFRDLGFRIVSDNSLPVIRHTPSIWNLMEESQINKLSKQNFGHFLKRWRHRKDILISSS